ncbi:MAG: UDP-3-O-(3-hydroxymyristoyl)glucosamine N-acyltransferase [Bacteroidaceae bacterium]|nr:UDP-3-O-(3-hydroxymyristoyl)glucosamine N-acyltransferase [Bacteroidaceae bacterium]
MEFSAEMIAGLIDGTIVGDPKATVNNFAKIEEGKPGCISFLANDKYEHYIYETESSIVLVNNNFEPRKEIKATLIKVANARDAVAKLLQIYESMKPKRKGISELAFIDPTAKIGKDCYIGPFVAIAEGVEIGDGCVFHPHVTIGRNAKVGNNTEIYSNAVIYHDCKVGNNCILHAGCVIGADGFGFEPTETGYNKIPQIGIAVIEDDVEIGANTCIDRAVMGETIVHKGVKLDNLIQIAHNNEIGSHTVMSAQVGIAGSTKVGEWCMFGGQVGIAGHATIADRTMVGAQAGIPNNIKKPGTAIQGSPAIEVRNFWKSSALFKNLPQIWADMNEMKKEIKALKEELAAKK